MKTLFVLTLFVSLLSWAPAFAQFDDSVSRCLDEQDPDQIAICTDLIRASTARQGEASQALHSLYFARGLAYERKNMGEKARLDYQSALRLDPADKDAADGLKRLGTP